MFGFLIVLLCIGAYFHCKEHGCPVHKVESCHQDALDIVRARYARGEISSEEFNERKKNLELGGSKK
ncbi:MAG: SHOCT domain-containing protein [Desulfosporosinus sp.]|nr:SHOCT domain-containing protein [Desulfosporosinus sp.]